MNIPRARYQAWITAALFLCAASCAWATQASLTRLYVYELPDGSRIVTDYRVDNKYYRLVRTGETGQKLGQLAAARTPEFFRTDTSAYDALILEKTREHNVDFALVKAIIHVESSFNPYAVSERGARGLMQVLPETAKRHGIEDIYDPAQNIEAGIRYLKYLTSIFGGKNHLIIAAYNAGENAVRRHGGIPPYLETQLYVRKVLQMKREYGKQALARS
jgi:soluble lytic murein transglycosylase-like protein